MKETFRAFRNRNYRLFFSGQSLSLIGTWMQKTAVSWVIYDTTKSTAMLGWAVFAQQFPSFLLSLAGGIVADRYDRFKLLLLTQILSMLQAAAMTYFVLTNNYSVMTILALSAILGIINAFDVPARQPLVNDMVSDKSELQNAVALNSSMVNFARLAAPALAGIVLHRLGAGMCFMWNTLSFVAVLSSLLLLKLPKREHINREKTHPLTDLKEGFLYLRNTRILGMSMLLLTITSFLVMSYDALITVFARDIFRGTAETYGYIRSFIGLGAISSTLYLASRKTGTDLKFQLLVSMIMLGISLILFSHITYLPLALPVAVFMGFGTMSQSTIFVTIIQVHSDIKMRGRIISYLAMAMFGMMPLGSLLFGYVSKYVGVQNVMLAQGIIALIISYFFSDFLRSDRLKKKDLPLVEIAEEEAEEIMP